MQLRSLLWVVATCVYVVHSLPCSNCSSKLEKRNTFTCTADYKGKPVEFKGEKAVTTGDVYMVTEAKGIPSGAYYIKTNLGPNELEISLAMGLIFAHNNEQDHTKQCIVMRNIGITIRNLPSYEKEAKPSEAGCEQWVDKKLDIVVMAVRNMRSHLMKDWAHRDLHYGNTRWKSETEVVLIDYGKAKMPYYFTDSQGQTRDLDEKAFLRKSWIGDLCHEQRGQKVAEIPSKIINPTVPVHA